MKNIETLISNKIINYKDSIKKMERRVEDIFLGKKKELIWFLYHDHIITQGVNASKNEIIKKTILPVVKTNRGGKTTYHGPGQRIVYFLINLNNRKKDIRKFINVIENSLIIFLKNYNIQARSFKDRVGIWVTAVEGNKLKKEEKIGAIGLRLKKWITYHGLSVNLNPDLNNYNDIHSCGLENYNNTSLKKLGFDITNEEFDKKYYKIFIKELNKI